MNVPEVVNVAIGLVVLYLLLSTIGSVLVDLVGQAFRYREEILTVTVNRLLTGIDDAPWGNVRLLRDFVVNQMAAMVPAGMVRSMVVKMKPKETPLPSTGDLARDHANREIVNRFWNHAKIRSLAAPDSLAPTWLEPATFASVLIDLSVPRDSAGALPSTRVALERRLGPGNTAAPATLRQSLLTLGLASTIPADATGESLWGVFQANVGRWYREAMDSASSRYRKVTQRWLLWIGFAMAVVLNADTIRVVHVLSHDKGLAEQVAAYGAMIAVPDTPETKQEGDDLAAARQKLAENLRQTQELERMGFPIGWRFEPENDFSPSVVSGAVVDASGVKLLQSLPSLWDHPWAWIVKLLGLAITAVAVSQGAPFWYDLLNKIVSIRRGQSGAGSAAAPTADAASAGGASAAGRTTAPTMEIAGATLPLDVGNDLAKATVGFDPRQAYWMAEAATLAYAPESEIARIAQKEWFFRASQFWSVQVNGVDTQAFAMVDDEVAIVSFRGTEPKVLNDILTDAKFKQTPFAADAWSANLGQVHGGFANALTPVLADMLQWLIDQEVEGKVVYVTGHSLGAALATLFTAHVLGHPGASKWRLQLYTFGSPLVGNRAFAAAFDRLAQGRVFRFVHGGDVVTQVPPRALGFSHVGEMLHFAKPEGLRREVSSLDRLLDFAIEGAEDLSKATKDAIGDHSMIHYVERCRKLTGVA